MICIAPSILAADFARLGEQVLDTERAGAHRIQIDVMDGHFVPNLSMGPCVVAGIRPLTKMPLEVHLMVEKPEVFIDGFIEAGADSFIVHHEVLPDPRPLLESIRGKDKGTGLAINPDTPVEVLEPYLAEIDLALCMTVHPGFSGQSYVAESPERIKKLRAMIERINPKCELEVDGGITEETAVQSVRAGANVLVISSAIFKHPGGPGEATRRILQRIASVEQS